ncbi:MAG: DUF167 domain-containing protein [Alphaproteobacteria bacterium]|nr:DUF167 domain-containing protein [Alphaproteobacteria bacterium]MBV9693415.1 DUF167 domain-containing protein [Alphaproteobacteria bacterium]
MIRTAKGGVVFRVRLTPKGGRDALEGWSGGAADGHLKARVRAAPEDGEANAALLALLARALGISRSSLSIAGGHKSRLKTIAAIGDRNALTSRLHALGKQA